MGTDPPELVLLSTHSVGTHRTDPSAGQPPRAAAADGHDGTAAGPGAERSPCSPSEGSAVEALMLLSALSSQVCARDPTRPLSPVSWKCTTSLRTHLRTERRG